MDKDLLKYLQEFVTPERQARFEDVLAERTRHITVAMENVYQSQNTSAIVRSCDCFGVQDVHIIENCYDFYVSPDVDMGSSKWLTMNHYSEKENNTIDCINHLKDKGYRIVATTPHTDDVEIQNLSLDKPLALLFGTEKEGLTPEALEMADEYVKIPMFGFTESFNVSVSAALSLQVLAHRLRETDIDWQLTEEEKDLLRLDWCKKSIRNPEAMIREYRSRV